MRLDRFFTETGTLTRSEAAAAIRDGRVTVDGITAVKPDMHIDENNNSVNLDGMEIAYSRFVYIMLNKPEGYVSATDDTREKTVLELVPEKYRRMNLFPCGRLDKYTVGLIILTNNGVLAHRLLSPRTHAEKVYYFKSEKPVTEIDRLESGIRLGDYTTKPAKIKLCGEQDGYITLIEGKYHQIRLMFDAVGNKISFLERVSFAGIPLDAGLARGEWRLLNEEEIKLIEQ